MLKDYSDTRCVYCGHTGFDEKQAGFADAAICRDAIVCRSCGRGNDVVDQVPFFGGYDGEDFIGLIEVIASQEMAPKQIDHTFDRYLHKLLGDYHVAADKPSFIATHPDDMVRAPWFAEHRYHEWMQTRAMLADRPLANASILNVGAGYGFDSVPFVDAGAQVTCIDYSPMIVALGRRGLPQARWIGGFSHALPFQDESFDIVCANAAMHHMRSTPVALREMLRVLKPGGLLFTVGDPVRPDASTDDHEFGVFNRHEGVLSGINEGIVKVGHFLDTLAQFVPAIDVKLLAAVSDFSRIDGSSPATDSGFDDRWVPWTVANLAALREQHGGICVAVTKRESFKIPPALQRSDILAAGTVAQWVEDMPTALWRLMAWAPEKLVNLPFPGERQDWFSLLNGWLAPEAPFAERVGFARSRWLLRADTAIGIGFDVKAPAPCDLTVLIDGEVVRVHPVSPAWSTIFIPFLGMKDATPFLVELRSGIEGGAFDDRCYTVRNRALVHDHTATPQPTASQEQPVAAVAPDRKPPAGINWRARIREAQASFPEGRLERCGYRIYSQSDEDGIIAAIFDRIGTTNRVFVEFGAETGDQNNCHLLLEQGWSGLWIEGIPDYQSPLTWNFRDELASGQLKFISEFVSVDNINGFITGSGIAGEIDLLSIDIDGNDWHIWKCIDCIDPRVVVIEHNGYRPPQDWVMPYDPGYVWDQKSAAYGSSLQANMRLAAELGYTLVATGLYSANGFFVRDDLVDASFVGPFDAASNFRTLDYDSIVNFPRGIPQEG